MSHSYAQNVLHVVFSTKDRRKAIPGEFQPRMWAYVAGICKKHEIFVHAVGGDGRSYSFAHPSSADVGIGQSGSGHQIELFSVGE